MPEEKVKFPLASVHASEPARYFLKWLKLNRGDDRVADVLDEILEKQYPNEYGDVLRRWEKKNAEVS